MTESGQDGGIAAGASVYMNPTDYLGRIHYEGPVGLTYETLKGLQSAHMQAVPFENLDIVPCHRPIDLALPALWNKLVVNRRGGFCYELNGLFAWLLRQLGFDVTYLNARVFNGQGNLGIDFDHLALLVSAPGQTASWLADVGFGDSFMEPLRLEARGEQVQGLRAYRLEATSEGYVAWQRNYDGTWERLYFFDLRPRLFPSDYESGCVYHQRSPESSFAAQSIVSIAVPEGRVSLEQNKLIITRYGAREERLLEDRREYDSLLRRHFGIVL